MKRGMTLRKTYYFLSSLDSRDLVRAAAFLWIRCFLTALSSALAASEMDFAVGTFRAFLTTIFKVFLDFVFCMVRARSWRNFLIARFMIGMGGSITHLVLVGQDTSDL